MEKKRISNAPLPENSELMSYKIRKVIARGNFSFVYLAESEQNSSSQ